MNDRSDERETALHYAARHGHTECAETLVKFGSPDLEAMDMWGATPLLLATVFKFSESVKVLVGYGADVFVQDRSNKTLLHHAAEHGMTATVELFLNHGLNPDVSDMSGNTALIEAVKGNHVQAAKILIERGCNVSIVGHCTVGRNYAWFTPLEIAVLQGHVTMTKLLVEAGCDLSVVNRWTDSGDVPPVLTKDAALLTWLQEAARGTRTLTDLCRQAISRALGTRRARSSVDTLPLPPSVRDFLAYRHLKL